MCIVTKFTRVLVKLLTVAADGVDTQPLNQGVCAGHGTRLVGWKSRYQVIAEPKVSERARALSRGRV